MKKILFSALIASVLFSACSKKDDSTSGTTRVNIRLTDAPGAFDALWLNVKEIKVLTSNGESTFAVNAPAVNILNFRLGKDTLIAASDVPSGRIQEIRLVLNETGNRVVVGGVNYALTTPSGQTSGIKLKVQDDLKAGIAYTMLLDFDVAKSIVQTGNGKYILKPVIRCVPNAVSGAITGVINPAMANPKIYAIAGVDTVGTISDANGKFWFPGIANGIYRIQIEPVSPYMLKIIDNVSVTSGAVKDLGTITLN